MKIYYYLQNNGDGTATPMFCESKEVADIMEEFDVERSGMGWGDSCIGYLEVAGDNLIPNYDWTTNSAILEVKEELENWDDSMAAKDALEALEKIK